MSITKISPSVVDFDAGITISTADNTSQLILTSTDADSSAGPVLELFRNSGSPADNDATGLIYFYGENDNDEKIAYGQIYTQVKDASDGSEDGSIEFYTMMGGTSTSKLLINSTETVFNEGSADVDFRVESNGNANAFFVDGGGGMVGFNTNSPTSDAGWTGFIHLAHTTNNAIILDGTDSQQAGIGAVDGLYIDCAGHTTATNNNIIFRTGSTDNNHSATERMRILSSGGLTFNGDTAAANALDDYEEGDWTPSIATGTFSASDAHYVKVGRFVHLSCRVNTFNDTSTNTAIAIGGLPYAVETNQVGGSVMGIYTDNTNADTAYCNTSETIYFYPLSSAGWDAMTHADLNNSGADFYLDASYRTT